MVLMRSKPGAARPGSLFQIFLIPDNSGEGGYKW